LKKKKMTARIGVFDIETAPFQAYVWSLWDQNISLNQIAKETNILSFAWKWLDSPKLVYMDTSGKGAKRTGDDSRLVAALWKLLDEADIVVAQNGASFDVKRVNARMVVQGLPPYSPIRVIDTKLVAKKHFAFSSNRQEWLARYLADSNKYKYGKMEMEDWIGCMADNPKSWAKMKKYNINDVLDCEKIYKKMRPWMDQHPNLGTYTSVQEPVCPKCGSQNLEARGTRALQQGLYQRFWCQDCRGWSRGKTILLPTTKRKALLA
jgi:hypothetical protein